MSMGRSGMRITSAPPAMPAWVAIQPACRPITSQTITRLCASAVECRRSMASVAMPTAVSKPNVRSVPERSLSIVLGTPTTFTPMEENLVATPRVSSPPMATTAPTFKARRFLSTISGPLAGFLNGLVREVPRMVPPRWRMPLVASRVSRSCSPRQPSRIPITSSPCCSPRRTTARITALRPGQSPPPVKTAIFINAPPGCRRRSIHRADSRAPQEPHALPGPPFSSAAARRPSRMELAPSHHHQGAQEEVLFRVGLAGAAAPGRPLEPLARDHFAVVRQAADQRGVAARQVALEQRPEQLLEPLLAEVRVAALGIEPSVETRADVQELVEQGRDALLRRRGAEELRPQRDAVERPAALQEDAGAALAPERADGRAGSSPRLPRDEEDPGGADVRQLRQGPHHVRHHAAAEEGGVGTLGAARAHLRDSHPCASRSPLPSS